MQGIFIFFFGLVIGSFLNVCIYRVPKGESIMYPSSHCTACGKKIRWYDMFPVISYIFLKGRCRSCGQSVSIRYPLVELLTGIIFMLIYSRYRLSIDFIKYAVLSSFLIVIGMIDHDTSDVYLKTILPGLIIGICFLIAEYFRGEEVFTYVLGALAGYGFIASIALLTKGMGVGDAEICLLCGLYLGLKLQVFVLFISFILGGIIGSVLVLTKKKTLKSEMPFGPFIAFAAIFTCIYKDVLFRCILAGL